MKKKLLSLVLIFIFSCSKKEDTFCGKIIYDYDIKTDKSYVDIDYLKKQYDKSSIFYYNSGSFFQTHEESILDFDYLDTENEDYYIKYAQNDTIYIYDATKNENFTLKSKSYETEKLKILDYECKTLIVNAHMKNENIDYSMKFYYSNETKIKGETFKNINHAFTNLIYGETNSIPLKFEMIYPDFTVICSAVKLEKMKTLNIKKIYESRIENLVFKKM